MVKAKKKKNSPDLTLRNSRASHKKFAAIDEKFDAVAEAFVLISKDLGVQGNNIEFLRDMICLLSDSLDSFADCIKSIPGSKMKIVRVSMADSEKMLAKIKKQLRNVVV